MTLAYTWVLNFLWLLPLAGFLLIAQNHWRRRARERFADPHLLTRLTPDDHKGKGFIKGLLLLGTLALLVVSLAGPRWGSRYQEVSRKGVDIMLVVDVSRSMSVEDIKPNRLRRAKHEIIDFLKVVQGDRVGLTAFAGAAFVQCPLTLDYTALEMFLSALEPGLIPVPGTDLGAAIETGLSAFDPKAETDKVMLLITDGEDNEQQGMTAARKATGKGVKIFVFGIGEPSGGPIPTEGNQGGFKKDAGGKLVLSRLDEQSLRSIASMTDGSYVRSVAGDLDLDLLYFDGIKQRTTDQTLKSGKIKVYEERFNVFALLAFLLLLLEGFVDDKRRPPGKKRFGLLLGLVAGLLAAGPVPAPVWAADVSPDELYRQGRYAEAEKAYARQDMDDPKDIRYRYNRGCAAFQNEKYTEAAAAFASVLKRTRDPGVRFRANFNLGNTAYQQGDFESAVAHYKQALDDNPASPALRHNLEMALRARARSEQKPASPQTDQPQDRENSENKEQGQQCKNPKNSTADSPDESKSGQNDDRRTQENQSGKPGQEAASGEKQATGADENRPGELRPRQAMSPLDAEPDTTGRAESDMDRQKAAALLENVQENPANMLRFMLPAENRSGAHSGKDW